LQQKKGWAPLQNWRRPIGGEFCNNNNQGDQMSLWKIAQNVAKPILWQI
jgi:hypothetical protein